MPLFGAKTPPAPGTQRKSFWESLIGMTPVFLTVLATVLAGLSSSEMTQAQFHRALAAEQQSKAGDQWNFFQAKSSKQNLAELGAALAEGDQRSRYLQEVERYKKEKEEIMPVAKSLEERAKVAEEKSEASMHVHHRWAQAMTMIQISIALAAITILTRNRALQYVSYVVAAISVAIGGLAMLHI